MRIEFCRKMVSLCIWFPLWGTTSKGATAREGSGSALKLRFEGCVEGGAQLLGFTVKKREGLGFCVRKLSGRFQDFWDVGGGSICDYHALVKFSMLAWQNSSLKLCRDYYRQPT